MSAPAAPRRIAAFVALFMFAAMVAVVVLILYRNAWSLALGLPGLAIASAAAWWLITETGLRRVIGASGVVVGLGLLFVAVALVVQGRERFFLSSAIVVVVVVLPFLFARYALERPIPSSSTAGTRGRTGPPQHPVLLCNPWSGGGKVERFGLIGLAEGLGVEVVMLDHGLDLEKLTRDAVARGADCLGAAGGDGSQALVASVAIEYGLPFVCIPAGTLNHFALDLGLDREDPRSAMYAFRDAVERRVDYATVNGRLFVNNVSLGIYATIVQSDAYRDAKVEVTTSMLTKLLGRQSETFDLRYTSPTGEDVHGAFLIMVSNNAYVLGAKRDVAQRRQLDSGKLGVFAVSTRTGSQAARLVTMATLGLRNVSKHFYEFTTDEFTVRSDSGFAFMGVDGEALQAATPLRFQIHAAGLRMFMPAGNLEIAEKRRARDVRLKDIAAVASGREPRPGILV